MALLGKDGLWDEEKQAVGHASTDSPTSDGPKAEQQEFGGTTESGHDSTRDDDIRRIEAEQSQQLANSKDNNVEKSVLGQVMSRISSKSTVDPGPPPDGGWTAWMQCGFDGMVS